MRNFVLYFRRKFKLYLFLIGLTFLMLFPLQKVSAQMPLYPPPPEERHEAVVTQIVEEGQTEVAQEAKQPFQKVEAEILEGAMKAKKVIAQMGGIILTNDDQKVKVGDKISVSHIRNIDGSEQFYVADFIRPSPEMR